MNVKKQITCTNKEMIKRAIKDSFVKLNPNIQRKNPVMFLLYAASIITTILFFLSLAGMIEESPLFTVGVAVTSWLTVLFANFAQAIAMGRGKAQADSLRAAKKEIEVNKILSIEKKDNMIKINSLQLKKGDLVIVKAGEQIPMDGEVAAGVASVDESAITGESAPVIRESGSDRSTVTGGTTVISDWIIVKVTSKAGESFMDKMIEMVEGVSRKKTQKETALEMILVAVTIFFLFITLAFYQYSYFSGKLSGEENLSSVTILVALFVCLAPTTIGALLSYIGIASMSRLNQANVLAVNEKAIEAAGKVDILMLDKTGTITLGNRQACEFLPVDGVEADELADAAQISSLAEETSEGRSIVVLAKEEFGIRERNMNELKAVFIPFVNTTGISGVDYDKNEVRKGAAESIKKYVEEKGGKYSKQCSEIVKSVAEKGGTPLVVAKNGKVLGVIHLKDIMKQGIKETFSDLRKMGMKTIMMTKDSPLTAAAIAAEAGVDDFLAEVTPERKLEMIKDFQKKGHFVAITGENTSDVPALLQADVAVAMNTGTKDAKESGNMIDLDSSPTKLIDIVRIAKQLYMTRSAITIFSITNDLAKYFAIIPVLFLSLYPQLGAFNILGISSVRSGIFSVIIYNALIMIALIPLVLKGLKNREVPIKKLFGRNVFFYGFAGVAIPFIFIKMIDIIITSIGIVK